jgi:hypothetical protein
VSDRKVRVVVVALANEGPGRLSLPSPPPYRTFSGEVITTPPRYSGDPPSHDAALGPGQLNMTRNALHRYDESPRRLPLLWERSQVGISRLPLKSAYRRYGDREQFEAALTDVPAAVVVVDVVEPGFAAWFRALRLRYPATRFICLAPLHAPVARAVVRAHPDDVMWWSGDRTEAAEFERRVKRLTTPSPRGCLDRMREGAEYLHLLATRVAVRRLCDVEQPAVSQVRILAREVVKASETKLREDWQKDFGDWTVKSVIDWTLWLRAACRFDCSDTVERNRMRIAMTLGIHESTLNRISKRVTGKTFARSMAEPGLSRTLKAFEELWQEVLTRVARRRTDRH